MDIDPDDDPTVEFPPVPEDDGPACGTAAAATYFLACFSSDAGVQFAERHCCCFRHIPHPAEVLPEGADLIEVVLQDAFVRTVVRDGEAEITLIPAGVTS